MADFAGQVRHANREIDEQADGTTFPTNEVLPRSPPLGEYVVLGIFDDSGIQEEEVLIYIGGHGFSQQLVKERRRLFKLPILRDIKAFELYKVSFSIPIS